jgi:hypothetical protein
VLELFVGAVQAYVFFMLTVAFISLGIPSKDDEHGDHNQAPEGTYDDVLSASEVAPAPKNVKAINKIK